MTPNRQVALRHLYKNQDHMTSDTLNQAAKSLKDSLLVSLKLCFRTCFLY